MTAESLAARLDLDPVEQGFVFRPVRGLGAGCRQRHDARSACYFSPLASS